MALDLWQVLSQEQQAEYVKLACKGPDATASFLASALNLPDYLFDARSSIRLDYVTYALEFARDFGFGAPCTSALLTVASNLYNICAGGASFSQAETALKTQLLALTSARPGANDAKLSPDQVAAVANFFSRTFFRHYNLYSYVHSHEQDHTHYTVDLMVETPIIQGFEGEAMSETEWHQYLDDVAAKAEAARLEVEEAERARVEAERAELEERERVEAEERRQAELAKKPATLEEAVEHAVKVRMEDEKKRLQSEYDARAAELQARIDQLQPQLPPAKAPGK